MLDFLRARHFFYILIWITSSYLSIPFGSLAMGGTLPSCSNVSAVCPSDTLPNGKVTSSFPVPASVTPPCLNLRSSTEGPPRIDLQACSVILRNSGLDSFTYHDTSQACKMYQTPQGLLDRIEQFYSYQVGCFYKGVIVSGTQTDPKHDGSCVGLGSASNAGDTSWAAVCNSTDGEDTHNHLGKSCGSFDSGQYGVSHFKGLSIQVTKYFAKQVVTEVEKGSLKITQGGGCEAIAQDYQVGNDCARCLSDNIVGGAGIRSFPLAFFTNKLDFCPVDRTQIVAGQVNISPTGVPSGMPAQYLHVSKGASCLMSAHRSSRIKLFEYLMHCEIDWRTQHFTVQVLQPAIAQGLPDSANHTSQVQAFFKNFPSSHGDPDFGTPVTLPSFVSTASSASCPQAALEFSLKYPLLGFALGLGPLRNRRKKKTGLSLKVGFVFILLLSNLSWGKVSKSGDDSGTHDGNTSGYHCTNIVGAKCASKVESCVGNYQTDDGAPYVNDHNSVGIWDDNGRAKGVHEGNRNGTDTYLQAKWCCDNSQSPNLSNQNPCFADPTPGCIAKKYGTNSSDFELVNPLPTPMTSDVNMANNIYNQCLWCKNNTLHSATFNCVASPVASITPGPPVTGSMITQIGNQIREYTGLGGGVSMDPSPTPSTSGGQILPSSYGDPTTAGGSKSSAAPGGGVADAQPSRGPSLRGNLGQGRSAGGTASKTGASGQGAREFNLDEVGPAPPSVSAVPSSLLSQSRGASTITGGGGRSSGRVWRSTSQDGNGSGDLAGGPAGSQNYGGGDSGELARMGEDPLDYFTRIDLGQDLFREVHRQYQSHAPSLWVP